MNNSLSSLPTTNCFNATIMVSNTEMGFSPVVYKFALEQKREKFQFLLPKYFRISHLSLKGCSKAWARVQSGHNPLNTKVYLTKTRDSSVYFLVQVGILTISTLHFSVLILRILVQRRILRNVLLLITLFSFLYSPPPLFKVTYRSFHFFTIAPDVHGVFLCKNKMSQKNCNMTNSI